MSTLQSFIARRLFPESLYVRGRGIAQEYLLEALSRDPIASNNMSVFVEDKQVESVATALGISSTAPSHFSVIGRSSLLEGRLDSSSINILIEMAGDSAYPFRVRNRFSSRIFPAISIQHGLSLHTYLFERILRTLLTPNYPCDSLLCSSEASKKALSTMMTNVTDSVSKQLATRLSYNGRVDSIPLCIDTERFCPGDRDRARSSLGLRRQAFVILYVGYLSIHKADWLPLLPGFKQLVEKNPDRHIMLILAGTGDARYVEMLREDIKDFGLSRNVVIKMNVPDNMRQELFTAADVFTSISDSVQESFGLAPVEAMACGIPQIVADWNGYRETVVNRKTGFIVPTYWTNINEDLMHVGDILGFSCSHIALGQSVAINHAEFFEAFQILLDKQETRLEMGARSRQRAIAEFSYQAIMKRHVDLWKELRHVADQCKKHAFDSCFDAPRYFDAFGHYASTEVNAESRLRFVRRLNAREIARIKAQSIHQEALDLKTLQRLLWTLERKREYAQNSEGVDLGSLTGAIGESGRSLSNLARHLLWLLKYGLVELVIPSEGVPSHPDLMSRST